MKTFGAILIVLCLSLLISIDIKDFLTKNYKGFRRYKMGKNELVDEISYDKLNVKIQILTDIAIVLLFIFLFLNYINSVQLILSIVVILLLKWSIKPIALYKGYVRKES